MLKKSPFFDFLNRRDGIGFEQFIAESVEDEHYINWNDSLLPMDYGNAEVEYGAIRNSCAMFDVSPIRKIRIQGDGAAEFLDRLLTRPVSQLPSMRATYTVYCNDDGSLKDDSILYKFSDDDYLLMPSDIDHSPYFELLVQRFELDEVTITECTNAWAGIAIQGPYSAAVLNNMGFDDIADLRPFEVRRFAMAGGAILVGRVGFTADLGYECWLEPAMVDEFIRRVGSVRTALDIALPGYGLSALQACRLEGGFVVAGWDFATEWDPQPGFERSPYELNLGWLVNLDAEDFVGRDALRMRKADGEPFTLRSFRLKSRGTLKDGTTIYANASAQAAPVGIVNCSNWSWGMDRTIGNASIRTEYGAIEEAWVIAAGEPLKIKLSRGPLINLERRNQVPAPTSL
jgi:aminomethyltransferase